MEKRYNSVDEVPEWGKETIEKLMRLEILKGIDSEREDDLDLSYDMLRMLVLLDRAKVFDF